MLENHLLGELDEDLMLELDNVVRANQLACLPFAKSGRAELLLHERHPELAGLIDEDRQRRIRDMAFRSSIKDEDYRLSSSFRARVGSLEDLTSSSPSHEKYQRRAKGPRNAPFSPSIRPKDSTTDLMFDMDDEDETPLRSLTLPKQRSAGGVMDEDYDSTAPAAARDVWHDSKGRAIMNVGPSSLTSPTSFPIVASSVSKQKSPIIHKDTTSGLSTSKPWSSPILPPATTKLDMREIMAQTSTGRKSALSSSLSAQKAKEDAIKAAAPKISQKERKKQQQQALQHAISNPQFTLDKSSPNNKPPSPWQVANIGPKVSLKDVINSNPKGSSSGLSVKLPESPLAVRNLNRPRTASPDTRFAGQQRKTSSTSMPKATQLSSSSTTSLNPSFQPQSARPTPLIPHSKSYSATPVNSEPSLQLSMADIIGQQKLEQDIIKEAVAKRSLQEIQEEQAFQEWWDQESRRAQEEEAAREKNSSSSATAHGGGLAKVGKGKRGRGGGAQRGRGDAVRGRGRGKGRGESPAVG
jgi:hypothetical protein